MNVAKSLMSVVIATIVSGSGSVWAAVSAEEAAKLKDSLTPFGAERAGNANGDIPAWTGGVTQPPANHIPGGAVEDPFAADKVIYTVSAQNYKEHAGFLTDGQKAMFEKHPGFRMNVYPTRRSAPVPQWVADNTFNNATNAELAPDGNGVVNAYGGIPFPIPQSGVEAIWNHNLRWAGEGKVSDYLSVNVYNNGSLAITAGLLNENYPFYDPQGDVASFDGNIAKLLLQYSLPVRRKGEVILIHDPVNQADNPRQAWQYIPGQRRVRRAPTIAFDTPNPGSNGMSTYDDAFMFNGSPERFDWKLVGKQEMLVPYNSYKFLNALAEGVSQEELFAQGYINPDYERWEKHRVWVVEATLKQGKRHIYGKRRFYLDEDSWAAILTDNYDGRGNLWRFNHSHPVTFYTQNVMAPRGFTHYDLPANNYTVLEYDMKPFVAKGPKDDRFYTPQSVRQLSLR